MKRIAIIFTHLFLSTELSAQQEEKPVDSFYLLSPVEVRALRVGENAPFARTNFSKKDISKLNLGQDIPFLLNQTPSVVINSDAGNGIGYTGIRIRGTDATRINVTLNGIPYNDAESQGTFFVDLPDLASSAGSIQIQRGVGTSTNGSGAFGGSINFSTNEINKVAYAEFNNSYGSFNTWKNTIKAGSGLLGDHFTVDARLSRITSDGYIDRASSDLHSFYISSAYISDKSSFRFNILSGKERTYQAWYGISQSDLDAGRRTINYAGTEKPGDPYSNETDNFKQDHYQLFFDHHFTDDLVFNTAVFLTKGKGHYEQYKAGESYSDYSQPDPSPGVTNTDLVRQLWLDNNFYGNIFSLQLQKKRTSFTLGGGWSRYDGNHYGDIIWAQQGTSTPTVRWYDHDARKTDLNIYFKQQTKLMADWHAYYDLQFRTVGYTIDGFRDHPTITVDSRFNFFNPKAGISYNKNGWKGFASFAVAGKEPNRDDFEANTDQQPKREKLNDLELGFEKSGKRSNLGATMYYMQYRDQLVLTGRINDVGAYTRTNIPKSYRLGIELVGSSIFSSWLNGSANLTLSSNKVLDFVEYIDDY
ncbi:MAG: TonB-dependent receptor plug domain-containing protein, partial [Chitinophagaceae bacterium]|nr:TonB-dependent receptor plug domain-containing protein [Chitinophagaceae bacterium]